MNISEKTMMRRIRIGISVGILSIFAFNAPLSLADNITLPHRLVEHVVWDKTPIKVTLPVGRERRIDFPVPGAKLEIPENILHKSKPIQLREDGSVYWTAIEGFAPERVQFITATGYSYFLDVEAVEDKKAIDRPLVIVDTRVKQNDDRATDAESIEAARQLDYDYVDLVRLASQSIYGPERLVKKLPGVSRIHVDTCPVRLYRGSQLVIEPMAQWKAGTLPARYVTAVRVTSNALEDVIFDPRRIRGDFLAASPQHPRVRAAGEGGDTTTWYLVSARPFNEVAPAGCEHAKEVANNE